MTRSWKPLQFALTLIVLAGWALLPSGSHSRGEEGMWTFDNPPLKQLKEHYGFTPGQRWLDHVRLSSVRFNDGGSGSFVSARGLVLTNHHVALGQLQKLSSSLKDYANDGFFAKAEAEELKCPDLELNVLLSIADVTARVQGAVKKGMSEEEALKARKAEMAKVEKESLEATGLRSDVVCLYEGGEYWLYRYKKYTDVRLVFAPERQIAFFGGDPDNFTFPRYDLDMALFRVYEHDKPLEVQHFLKWNAKGPSDGELVFVSGHPGSTNRQVTLAQIEAQRDHYYPLVIKALRRRLDLLRSYAARGPEQEREARDQIFGLENSLKALGGEYNGLRDKSLIDKLKSEENDFRNLVERNPEWQKEFGNAWAAIAGAESKRADKQKQSWFRTFRTPRLANLALAIVQYDVEVKKPDGERLDGFHDAQLESLRFRLFSPAPVYPRLEEVILADKLREARQELGSDDPFVRSALGVGSAEDVAQQVVAGTKLVDPAFRRSLVEGGEAAVAASTDPLIVFMRRVEPAVRETRKWVEDNVESVETSAGEKIAKARFAAYGKSVYPDATFTLRLAFGTVRGYPMNGTRAPSKTTIYGLYDRAYSFDLRPPFDLPSRYLDPARKGVLGLSTPLDFVSDCDITGGNSGSPVINRSAELVGLIFDGNIESLVGTYAFNAANNRAVAVDSAAMIEALRKLYDAGSLADELEGRVANEKGAKTQ